MATDGRNLFLITYLLVLKYCSILLLTGGGGPKGTIPLMVNGIQDPIYELTDELHQESSENNLNIKSSADNLNVNPQVLWPPPGCPTEGWEPRCFCDKPGLWFPALDTDCNKVEGEEDLAHIFRTATFVNTNFRSFRLTGNPYIRVLHPGVFQHITFDEIHMGYNGFERVERGVLDLMKGNLKVIDMFRANFHKLEDFPFDEIHTFQKLERLEFGMNRLPSFPDIASESLKYIDFGANPINIIKQDAFRELPKLESIYLDGTNLAQIFPGTFKGLPYLTELGLAGNHFTEILAGAIVTDSLQFSYLTFENNLISNFEPNSITMDATMLVDIGSNPISQLPESFWRPVLEQGGTIRCGHLFMECDCSIAWFVLNPFWLSNVTSGYCTDYTSISNLDPDLFAEC